MARSSWSAKDVDILWRVMAQLQGLRQRGNLPAWWGLVAARVNDEGQLGVMGTTCANKAVQVRNAGRAYPWEESDEGASEVLRRLDRIEQLLYSLVERNSE